MSDTGTAEARHSEPVDRPHTSDSLPLLIGHSPVFSRLREDVGRVATIDAPSLVMGESGSGRTLLSAAIHHASVRRGAPLEAVSCSEVPETLLETELFGCLKGSVVGASADRMGVLDRAHGGTVLLEDIDQMPLRVQDLLARFLESGEVKQVGTFGDHTVADVRVLATTTTSLRERVQQGLFLEELWSLIDANTLVVPPLRSRREDVPILADYFAGVHCADAGRPGVTFGPNARHRLMEFSWPGNVRQLRAVVDRLVRQARTSTIGGDELPVGIRPRRTDAQGRGRERRREIGEELFVRLVAQGESFWSCVYPLFVEREITRSDLRDLIRRGLEVARGNSETLVRLFNMPASDHRRFVSFLRKYDCQLPLESAR
jgi:two-component system, NtrC family, response regulator AtoC